MAKKSRTFRISEDTDKRLVGLAELFGESGGEIVERAILLLHDRKAEEIEKDNAARKAKL